jgi:hypothetical protein
MRNQVRVTIKGDELFSQPSFFKSHPSLSHHDH